MHAPQAGDTATATADGRTELITRNLPLARFLARRMAPSAGASLLLTYEDLVGYGCEGLIAAADTFDASRGVRFSTWAGLHIRTTIQDAARRVDPLSRMARTRTAAIHRVSSEQAARTGCWPTAVQLATLLNLPLPVLQATMQLSAMRTVSLDAALDDDGADHVPYTATLADDRLFADPQRALDDAATPAMVRAAVAALPARERTVVEGTYLRGRGLAAIGRELGVSASRVSQMRTTALNRLRPIVEALLTDTLDASGPVEQRQQPLTT
jgi:RNA polymerase sigma factor FliA